MCSKNKIKILGWLSVFYLIFTLIIVCSSSGTLLASNGNAPFIVDFDSSSTKIIKERQPYNLFLKSEDKDDFTKSSDTISPVLYQGETEITLYLRDKGILSETMGDPVPWLTRYIYPSGTTSMEWEVVLGGDITGSFYYQIDVVECPASAQIKIEFIVDQDGIFTTVASQFVDLDPLLPEYYHAKAGTISGSDLQTQDGDRLIFRITHVSGTDIVGVGLDGVNSWSDSRIKIVHRGPVACFTVNPDEGDLLTQFNVDASCSYDSSFPAANLEVRWDWENDGDYDTAFTTTKTAYHQYSLSGIKSIKLQVKNPDGLTGTKIHDISIPIVIVDSFSTPGPAPTGLTWNGTHLWLSDVYNDIIYQLTPSGGIENSFASPCGDPMDLAWDGTHLWVIDAWGTDDEGNWLYKIDTSGNLIGNRVEVPMDISTGLTWDGHYLWGADATNGIIRKLDPATGGTIVAFRSPGYDPRGLAWDGQNLWNTDFTGQKIYQFDVNGRIINTWPSPGSGPMGLTWDGKYLWCVDLNSYTVYKLADKIPTKITCELSKSSMTFGELLTISGLITPSPDEAGKGVSIELIPPDGETVYKATLANINGEFEHTLVCGDIHRAGTWTVGTSWAGSGPYGGAISEYKTLEVSKAETRVTLDVTSQAIKLGDLVSISGKFTPLPDCGNDLENIPLTIVISGPGGSDSLNVSTNDKWGHFLLEDYAGFNKLGEWSVQVNFAGNHSFLSANSDSLDVNVVETAGYAVIIQGKISNEEGLASHNKTTNAVYKQLRNRGLSHDDIMYFNYDTTQQDENNVFIVDDVPSRDGTRLAITQWGRDKMNDKPANLCVVMVDHGLEDVFYIHPDTITSAELDSWLDTLQGTLTGQATNQEIITILGFCRSGSFIDNLSGNHRVNIASAASGESSYKGPLDEDGIREGEYFINEFFKSVSLGKTIKQNFQEAVVLTEAFTSSDSADSTNAPYFDKALQHPLLDDNGDGVGTNLLSDQATGDGALSQNLIIGVSSITGNDPGDVQVTQVTGPVFLGLGTNSVSLLWATVDDNTRLRTIWVEVKPPLYNPLDQGGSEQVEMGLAKTYGVYNASTERYEWSNLGGFSNSGTYQILYFAKDDQTENVSPLKVSTVYKAKAGNTPPNPFDLVDPGNGATTLTQLIFDWEDTTDPSGDLLSYTVLLSEDDNTFSNPIRKDGLAYSTCLVTADDGLTDLSTYYWKVQAIDEYGAIRETGVRVFHTNNINPVAAWINGHVYDSISGQSLANAVVSVGNVEFTAALGGYYLGLVVPGTYTITASADGYNPKSYTDLMISDADLMTKDFALVPLGNGGDSDSDGMPDWWELQYFGNLARDGTGDWDGDGLIDLAEFEYGTDPTNPDTDGDGFTDGDEVGAGTDPNDPQSHPSKAMPWIPLLLLEN